MAGWLAGWEGTMVIKTDLCAFSEYRVYPGHGVRFARRDGQLIVLSNSKCKSLHDQRKKPAKLMWTQAWRRLNKKMQDTAVTKKRSRKTTKLQRAIVGASLEEIKKKRSTKPSEKSVARQAAIKELKAARKAAAKKDVKKTFDPKGQKPAASKSKGGDKNARAGSKR